MESDSDCCSETDALECGVTDAEGAGSHVIKLTDICVNTTVFCHQRLFFRVHQTFVRKIKVFFNFNFWEFSLCFVYFIFKCFKHFFPLLSGSSHSVT